MPYSFGHPSLPDDVTNSITVFELMGQKKEQRAINKYKFLNLVLCQVMAMARSRRISRNFINSIAITPVDYSSHLYKNFFMKQHSNFCLLPLIKIYYLLTITLAI